MILSVLLLLIVPSLPHHHHGGFACADIDICQQMDSHHNGDAGHSEDDDSLCLANAKFVQAKSPHQTVSQIVANIYFCLAFVSGTGVFDTILAQTEISYGVTVLSYYSVEGNRLNGLRAPPVRQV